MIRRDVYLDVEEEGIHTSVTRQKFKPDLVTAGFLEAPSFLSPTPVVAFVLKASTELTFHSKCINPFFRALLLHCTLPASISSIYFIPQFPQAILIRHDTITVIFKPLAERLPPFYYNAIFNKSWLYVLQ